MEHVKIGGCTSPKPIALHLRGIGVEVSEDVGVGALGVDLPEAEGAVLLRGSLTQTVQNRQGLGQLGGPTVGRERAREEQAHPVLRERAGDLQDGGRTLALALRALALIDHQTGHLALQLVGPCGDD